MCFRNKQSGRSPGWPLETFTAGLLLASCLYLVLPYLIFFLGWLKWWVALPAVILLAVPVYATARTVRQPSFGSQGDGRSAPVRWHHLLLVLIAALMLSGLSGTGGYGAQDSDHPKHNAILKCLVEEPWPATVESEKGPFPLVYYIGWYLPAALFGKMAGWEAANHFWQFWTVLGLVLSILWFCVLCRRVSWLVLGVFVFFSGLDVVGASLLKFLEFTARPEFDWRHFDWGSVDWASLRWWNWQLRWWDIPALRNYSSNMALLFFVPQQALAGWILAGIMAFLLLRGGDQARRTLLFYYSLSCLWSPFVTIGLTPLLFAHFIMGKGRLVERMKGYLSLPNLCGLGVVALMILYYLARFSDLPFTHNASAGFGFWNPPDLSASDFLWHLLLFCALEVGVLAWLVWSTGSLEAPKERRLFFVALGFLLILPVFKYGAINDLVMRASIPCLFLLAVFVAKAAVRKQVGVTKRLILFGVLALAAANPVAEIYRHLREVHRQGHWVGIPDKSEVETLWAMNCDMCESASRIDLILLRPFRGDTFFLQYVGSPDSVFFRYLARRPSPADDVPPKESEQLSGKAPGRAAGRQGTDRGGRAARKPVAATLPADDNTTGSDKW